MKRQHIDSFDDNTPPSITEESTTNRSIKRLKPASLNDHDLCDQVLKPRSIEIAARGKNIALVESHVYFNVKEPPQDQTLPQYYCNTRKAGNPSLWLKVDPNIIEDIVERYHELMKDTSCESEFMVCAFEFLLKRVPLKSSKVDESHVTGRLIHRSARPGDTKDLLWAPPPFIEPNDKDLFKKYEFNLHPDCSYWLSEQGFDTPCEYLEQSVYVSKGEYTCPYFTVEFKKDNSSVAVAQNQVACAASLALYNRYHLRNRRLKDSKMNWTPILTRDLRHYGLTMDGDRYTVWCIEAKLSSSDWSWIGCRMEYLDTGKCVKAAGVRRLMLWINEIHCWGLTQHGPSCAEDVRLLVQAQRSIIVPGAKASSESESSTV